MISTLKVAMVAAAVSAAALSVSAPALADPLENLTGGVIIMGHVDQDTNVSNVTTTAKGKNAMAGTSIGSIHDGVKIVGYVKQKTRAKNVTTLAQGKNAKACTSIGTIGNNPSCGADGGVLGGLVGLF